MPFKLSVNDPDPVVRRSAAFSLGIAGIAVIDPSVCRALKARFKDDDSTVQYCAAYALLVSGPLGRAVLESSLHDSDQVIAETVRLTLEWDRWFGSEKPRDEMPAVPYSPFECLSVTGHSTS